ILLGFIGLTLLATLVHLYIYVMTSAIAAAAFLQAIINRRTSLWCGIISIAVLPLAGIVSLWFLGLFDSGNLLDTQGLGYGVNSMNVVSPFWPQTSGLFRWTGIYWLTRGSVGATTGQYEGSDYLGSGALLLLGITIWRDMDRIPSALKKYSGLV